MTKKLKFPVFAKIPEPELVPTNDPKLLEIMLPKLGEVPADEDLPAPNKLPRLLKPLSIEDQKP